MYESILSNSPCSTRGSFLREDNEMHSAVVPCTFTTSPEFTLRMKSLIGDPSAFGKTEANASLAGTETKRAETHTHTPREREGERHHCRLFSGG